MIAPTDVWTNFRDQVQNYLSTNPGNGAWWNWVVGGVAGTFSLILQAIAVIVFPISYAIFSFFYSMYGAVLYVIGPLVLALYPALGVGQLAKTFMVNLLVWNAWGIIYAIFSQLLTIMSANSLANIFTAQNIGGAFQGASQMLLISLASILLSIMILMIPFLAKRIVSGDVGSTMFAVAGIAAAAVQTAVAGWAGMQGGAARRRLRQKVVEVWAGAGFPQPRLVTSQRAAREEHLHQGRPRKPPIRRARVRRHAAIILIRGIRLAAPDTLGTTTFRTPSDGQWEPGRARRAGR